jgi:hypothetical protein
VALTPPPEPQLVPSDADSARAFAAEAIARAEATIERASSFSEEDLQRGVDGEWSTVQSLRHLVLVVDVWLSRTILGEKDPFHPMALPPHFMPPKMPGTSIDPDAAPSFAEACEALRGRFDILRTYTNAVVDEALRVHINNHAKTVGGGLGVLFDEFAAHDYFMNRDLDKL